MINRTYFLRFKGISQGKPDINSWRVLTRRSFFAQPVQATAQLLQELEEKYPGYDFTLRGMARV